MAFAALMPPEIPRIALVDFNNDCVGDSLRVMSAMFSRWMQLTDAGRHEEAQRFAGGRAARHRQLHARRQRALGIRS